MAAEPSRFDVCRRTLAFVALFLAGACTNEIAPSPYSVQYGILPENSQIKVQEVKLDSIQFADAKFRYVVSGHATIAGKRRDFSVISLGHPFKENSTIVAHVFPLRDVDSSKYSCSMYGAEKNLVIDWMQGQKRLKLVFRRSLISKE